MSNAQVQTRGLSAGDWVRLKRLRGALTYQTVNLDTNKDINPTTPDQLPYHLPIHVFDTVGTSKIRRTASNWIDYKASQTADYVVLPYVQQDVSADPTNAKLGVTRLCDCVTSPLETKVAGCIKCIHDPIENYKKCPPPPPVEEVILSDLTSFGGIITWAGEVTNVEIKVYESPTTPVDVSSSPIATYEGDYTSGTFFSFPTTDTYYYVVTIRVREYCNNGIFVYSAFAYSPEIMFSRWTFTARESNQVWEELASSADGTKLVAVVNSGQIYTSTDSGASWTPTESNRNWISVASSADGVNLVAVVANGRIYTSTDSGVSWTEINVLKNWFGVASSADGTKLVAVAYNNQIYTSTNSGASWTARDSNRLWTSVASSADGVNLYATVENNFIYKSTDSGVTWNGIFSGPNGNWTSITTSADGSIVAAVVSPGQIYISSDFGVTWNAVGPTKYWTDIASSADGTKLIAVSQIVNPADPTGRIFASTDSGVTWIATESSRSWYTVASSADGDKVVAGVLNGRLYTGIGI